MRIGYTRKLEKMTDELRKMKRAVFVPDAIMIEYDPEDQVYHIEEISRNGKGRGFTVKNLADYVIIPEYKGTVVINMMTTPDGGDGDMNCFNAAELREQAGIQGAFSLEFVKDDPDNLTSEYIVYPYE